MGLHAILEAIRQHGDLRVSEIESHTYAQTHQVLMDAQLEAERLTEQACEKTLEPVAHERARLIHRARLEAMQILGEARKELVDAALEQVRGRLINLRTDVCYPDVLHQLLCEALAELNVFKQEDEKAKSNEQIHLEANLKDRALVESTVQRLGLDLSVDYTLDCWGGVVAKGENGQIVVINTLEARLAKAIPYLRLYLAAFFENEANTSAHGQPFDQFRALKTQSEAG